MSGMFTQLQQSGGVLTKQNMITVLFMQMTHPVKKTALKLLVVAMKCPTTNKAEDPLCYSYQEYEVNTCSLTCSGVAIVCMLLTTDY